MRYWAYKLLQLWAHGDYLVVRKALQDEFATHCNRLPNSKESRVLELGCGGGNMCTMFPGRNYVGVDMNRERIEAARIEYPEHTFHCCGAEEPAVDRFMQQSDFIFGLNFLHHIDDDEVKALLDRIRENCPRPATFLVMEPALSNPKRNPIGYMLAKLDAGEYIRPSEEYRKLLGSDLVHYADVPPLKRWPVPGFLGVVRFAQGSATADELNAGDQRIA
jgi:2-polyprenyl-3-methyl-5-hydroxy-6-metoxy-1,4-benzoquinol methylase